MAGHKTLLIEAGDDADANVNTTVPSYSAKASEDEALAWNFFVRHYADDACQARDPKTTYETGDGRRYTGLSPPAGARMLGTLYPRAAALGGCGAHNALVTVYPHRSDWDGIARLTGDASWAAERMRAYLRRLEHNRHLLPALGPGHGFGGWLSVETAPADLALTDPQLLSLIVGGALALGNRTQALPNLATVLAGDANADTAQRDRDGGYFQTPRRQRRGRRVSARDLFTWAVLKAHPRNRAGSVTLRSADPLDPPHIAYNYFDTGRGDAAADLRAMREGIRLARDAFRRQIVPVAEELPGPGLQTDAQLDAYIRDTAWGHHASSTCPIGADDPMAVLDSSFRVRGVCGLRVVDASVFPRIPGTFPALSTYMVGEKAADVILSQLEPEPS